MKIALIKAFKYFFLDSNFLPLMKGFKTKTLISGHVSIDNFTRFSIKIGSLDPWEIYFLLVSPPTDLKFQFYKKQ